MSHTLQSALESGHEARIVQTDFSAAFYRVNHHGILYKFCSEGIGGSVLSILGQFRGVAESLIGSSSRVPDPRPCQGYK